MISDRNLLAAGLFVALSFSSLVLQAHQPPRPGEISYLEKAGLLEDRLAMLEHLKNDHLSEHLHAKMTRKIERAKLEAQGLSADQIAARMQQYALPSPGELQSSGSPNVLTLLIDFNDYRASELHPNLSVSDIDDNIYGNGTTWSRNNAQPFESLNRFWYRASQGQFDIQGSVLGWYNFPNNRSTYEPETTSNEDRNQAIFDMVKEALQSYDATHDFSQYDNDNDGDIDAIQIVYTGPDNGWGNFWWAYKWEFWISDASNTRFDGKRLRNFTWQWVSTMNNGSDFNIRTMAHEMGHAIGLPDLYDYTPNSGLKGGVGGLDIMAGNRGNPNAFLRWVLDWITPTVVGSGVPSSRTLRSSGDMSSNSDKAVVVFPGITSNDSSDNRSEFFIVENRHRTGNDAGTSYMPSDGVTIWHVDSSVSGGNFTHSNADRNGNGTRKLVKLVQADGLEEIENGSSADAGDYYNAGEEFTASSNPSSARYSGAQTNVEVKNFSANGNIMTADIGIVGASGNSKGVIATPTPGTVLSGSNVTFTWQEGSNAQNYHLYVGSTQGGTQHYNSGTLSSSVNEHTASGLPTDGSTIWVRLWTRHTSGWSYNDYQYTAGAGTQTRAEIRNPEPGSTLGGSATFEWSAGQGANAYWLFAGSSSGTADIHDSGLLSSATLSEAVSGIPTDGRTIYVRIYTRHGSTWSFNEYRYTAGMTQSAGEITNPTDGSTVSGPAVTFSIGNGSGVTNYWLYVGSTPGTRNYYDSGSLPSTTSSHTATGIPENGSTIHVRLWSRLNGVWHHRDYSYQTVNEGETNGDITSPTPNSTLSGDTVTFEWDLGQSATAYWLYVGSTTGGSQYHSSGRLGNTTTQNIAAGLPRNGSTVFVRLWTQHASGWSFNDYQYTAASPTQDSKGEMTSPAPGSTLSDSTETFTWDAGNNADQYWLYVGRTQGSSNYFSEGASNTTLTKTVSGLPVDGSSVWIRLWTRHGNTWTFQDYEYTAHTVTPGNGEITSPPNNATFTSRTVTFQWDAGNLAQNYYLYVGDSPGSSNIHSSGTLSSSTLSHTVAELPNDGRALHVTLWTFHEGTGWSSENYEYTAVNEISDGEITTPAPGSTFSDSTVTFFWDAGGGADRYYLMVGSQQGGSNIYASGTLSSSTLSRTVTNLPQDGSMIHVRLWTLHSGTWSWRDYEYYADTAPAEIFSPADGATLSDRSQFFQWSSESDISGYFLYIGSSPGSRDHYNSGSLDGGDQSHTATGLPTDGSTIYARLWSQTPNGWESSDYSYTAATIQATSAELSSHQNNDTLNSTTETFSWNEGQLADGYQLNVGSSDGGSDYYNSGFLDPSELSREVAGLPQDGSTVHVTLWTNHDGVWSNTKYTFSTIDEAETNAVVTSPNPGSTLSGDTVTFMGEEGTNASSHWAYVGTSGAGSSDVFSSSVDPTSFVVSDIPTDGSTVYVRLWTRHDSGWSFEDYTYTASSGGGQNSDGEITSPAPNSTFDGTSVTFHWNAGNNASNYYVYVGTSQGSSNVDSSGTLSRSTLSWTTTGLPSDGSTLHVRLWTHHSDTGWSHQDYQYTAWNNSIPEITSPDPGSTVDGYDWFYWTTNGADVENWYLDVADASSNDVRFSVLLDASNTSQIVPGLPRDGSTFTVTLWWKIDGVWDSADFEYTAANIAADDVGNYKVEALDLGDNPGTSRSHQIGDSNDVDVFELNLTQSADLRVYTSGSTDTVGYILDEDGNPIADNDDSGSGLNFSMLESLDPGTYFISVRSWGSDTGSYTLNVTTSVDASSSQTILTNADNGDGRTRGGKIGDRRGTSSAGRETGVKTVTDRARSNRSR